MTARDSYRKPISSFEAIQELRRVSGAQLDAEYVEIFIKILAGKDVRFRHGEDADFDAELGLDKRVARILAAARARGGSLRRAAGRRRRGGHADRRGSASAEGAST